MKKTIFVLLALLVLASAAMLATAQVKQQKCPTCGKSYSECPNKFKHPKQSTPTSNKGKKQAVSKKNSTNGKVTGGSQKSKRVSGQKDNKTGNEDRHETKPQKEETVMERSIEQKPVEQKPAEQKPAKKNDSERIYSSVEQMPQFPGGDAALMRYLGSHLQYPPEAAKKNIQGKVILQFVVEKDGRVGEVKVARSVDKDLDQEAIRVVKSLPKFTPGRQNGQVVRVWYTLPVTFKLQGTN